MAIRFVPYEGVIQTYITAHALSLVGRAASEVEARAKLYLAPHSRTGRLASSIHTVIEPGDMSATARVGSDLDYAAPVHEGQRAHVIRARPGHILWLGGDRFARVVHHPPVRGRPFLMTPLETVGREMDFIVRSEYRSD